MQEIYRLNRRGNSSYVEFTIDGEDAIMRTYRFPGADVAEQKRMTISGARAKYAKMLTETEQFLPHDKRRGKVWIPAI